MSEVAAGAGVGRLLSRIRRKGDCGGDGHISSCREGREQRPWSLSVRDAWAAQGACGCGVGVGSPETIVAAGTRQATV